MYIILCCIPETNSMLYVNYISKTGGVGIISLRTVVFKHYI